MESIGVSAFIEILNETLGFAYPEVVVQGEISGYKVNQGKWAFFDLKDHKSTLSCFMPVWLIKVPVEDGMSVRVTGSPKLLASGKFSFTARSLDLAGEGALKRAFELLKAKLESEGLFEPARKRALPPFPKRIGLVTAAGSAAYQDFLKITSARWGGLAITTADVVVQGPSAPESVVAALAHFNQVAPPLDVVVVIRGGGSLEDLAAFSTEPVVRAIAASRTPVVVGVGHESDTSLADLAADVRAATPTDAARLVVPDRIEVERRLNGLAQTATMRFGARLTGIHHRLDHSAGLIGRFLDAPTELVARQEHQLQQRFSQAVRLLNQRVESLGRLLAGLDPKAILERGYGIIRHQGQVIKTTNRLKPGDALMIQLAKGQIGAKVDDNGQV